MSHQQKPIYEFGPYRLDASERLLSRDGEVVPLQPKIFDLLLVMVERHGRLLEKDELMKAVWPDTVVEEVNLANNISILRKTIGENGRQFIETAPKRGYRFVAEVREVGRDGHAPTAHLPVAVEEKVESIEEVVRMMNT
jgi:DNA-binding winged helix-turn-helix (wHTH) protein